MRIIVGVCNAGNERAIDINRLSIKNPDTACVGPVCDVGWAPRTRRVGQPVRADGDETAGRLRAAGQCAVDQVGAINNVRSNEMGSDADQNRLGCLCANRAGCDKGRQNHWKKNLVGRLYGHGGATKYDRFCFETEKRIRCQLLPCKLINMAPTAFCTLQILSTRTAAKGSSRSGFDPVRPARSRRWAGSALSRSGALPRRAAFPLLSMSTMAGRPQAAGYIARGIHPESRRRNVLEMTDKGRTLLDGIVRVWTAVDTTIRDILESDSAAFVDQTRRLRNRLGGTTPRVWDSNSTTDLSGRSPTDGMGGQCSTL